MVFNVFAPLPLSASLMFDLEVTTSESLLQLVLLPSEVAVVVAAGAAVLPLSPREGVETTCALSKQFLAKTRSFVLVFSANVISAYYSST